MVLLCTNRAVHALILLIITTKYKVDTTGPSLDTLKDLTMMRGILLIFLATTLTVNANKPKAGNGTKTMDKDEAERFRVFKDALKNGDKEKLQELAAERDNNKDHYYGGSCCYAVTTTTTSAGFASQYPELLGTWYNYFWNEYYLWTGSNLAVMVNPYGSEWVIAYDDDDYYYYYDYDGEKLAWSSDGSDCPYDPMTWTYNSVSTGGWADAQVTVTPEDWSCPSVTTWLPPPPSRCNGPDYNKRIIQQRIKTTAVSAEACKSACNDQMYCISYNWRSRSTYCRLFLQYETDTDNTYSGTC